MMKGLLIQQQQQQQVVMDQENMSNLTCASGDQGSASSDNINLRADQDQPPLKKKRNLPGNPDPEAEVVALSPKTLMATNRFVCEVCNKGFQRDQNLQLHRRGHNLPWKLKQRSSSKEVVVRKKVYVCPEVGCVHHEGGRALGDLTGIKKHYSRKHGEKKWKCDKCSKRYAVQSDWKAHSKICGTREYRCDCGTLFSRRDSFITHRAFCDALAEESARAVTGLNPAATTGNLYQVQQQPQLFSTTIDFNPTTTTFSLNLKKELQHVQHFPPWLTSPPPPSSQAPFLIRTTRLDHKTFTQEQEQAHDGENSNTNQNPSGGGGGGGVVVSGPTMLLPPYHQTSTTTTGAASAHMSATALLQKAAQMGATTSLSSSSNSADCTSTTMMIPRGPHHHGHVPANSSAAATTGFGLYLSSRDHMHHHPSSSYFQDMLMMNALSSGLISNDDEEEEEEEERSTAAFEDAMVNDFLDAAAAKKDEQEGVGVGGEMNRPGNGGDDGMTRDFLGLSHTDIMTMAAGLSNSLAGIRRS